MKGEVPKTEVEKPLHDPATVHLATGTKTSRSQSSSGSSHVAAGKTSKLRASKVRGRAAPPAHPELAAFMSMLPDLRRLSLDEQKRLYEVLYETGASAYLHIMRYIEEMTEDSSSLPAHAAAFLPFLTSARSPLDSAKNAADCPSNISSEHVGAWLINGSLDELLESLRTGGEAHGRRDSSVSEKHSSSSPPVVSPDQAAWALRLFAAATFRRPPTRSVESQMAATADSGGHSETNAMQPTARDGIPLPPRIRTNSQDASQTETDDEDGASSTGFAAGAGSAGLSSSSEHHPDMLLALACAAGYADLARSLLRAQDSPDFAAQVDCSPLMEASAAGHLQIVRELLRAGAAPDAQSATRNTALSYAAAAGHAQIVRELLETKRVDVHAVNDNGHDALMEAASGDHLECVRLLLAAGARCTYTNTQAEFKESALTLASYKGNVEMVRFLLDQIDTSDPARVEELHTALMESCMDGHVEVARILLERGAPCNLNSDSFESPLTLAACGGHLELVRMLLDKGARLEETNDEGYTPLMEAAHAGHVDVVRMLIRERATLDVMAEETGETALTLAACGGFLDVVQELVAAGADLEAGHTTALVEAAQEGHDAICLYIVETMKSRRGKGAAAAANGWEPAQQTSLNNALVLACESSNANAIVDALLDAGADVNFEGGGGRTALMKAAKAGNIDLLKVLLNNGVNPSQVSAERDATALSLACAAGRLDCVKLLLEAGADPSTQLHDGTNCFLEAAKNGHADVINLLIEKRALNAAPRSAMPPPVVSTVVEGTVTATESPVSGRRSKSKKATATTAELHISAQSVRAGGVGSAAAAAADLGDTISGPAAFALSQANADPNIGASLLYEILAKHFKLSFQDMAASEDGLCEAATAGNLSSQQLPDLVSHLLQACVKGGLGTDNVQDEQLITSMMTSFHQMAVKMDQQKTNNASSGNTPAPTSNADAAASDTTPPPTKTKMADFLHSTYDVVRKTVSSLPKFGGTATAGKASDSPNVSSDSSASTNKSDASSKPGELSSAPDALTDGHPVSSGCDSENPAGCTIDINVTTESNTETALCLAAANGQTEVVQLLCAYNAHLEHRDKKGFTPLILAATGGHVQCCEALLRAGAQVEAQSERTKDTALSLACSGGRKDVVELLLRWSANKEHRNVSDYTPLSLAASGGYVEIVNLLLTAGAEINSRTGSKLGITPVMLSAMNGHREATRVLLEKGSDVNAQIETNRNTALTLACFQGRTEVVRLLLEHGSNCEHRAKTGLTPLMEAANGGFTEVGTWLLDHGADVNALPVPTSRDTALTIAADKGHARFVSLLVQRGAQLDVRNKKGCTALWLACHGGHLETVEVLVRAEADLNAQDNRRITPLIAAFRKTHVKVVKFLCRHVTQFPSDTDMHRFIATLSDRELIMKCEDCMHVICQAKDRQAAQANRAAESLLQLLEQEEQQALNKKLSKQRQKEKKKAKKEAARKAQNVDPKDEEDEEDDDTVQSSEPAHVAPSRPPPAAAAAAAAAAAVESVDSDDETDIKLDSSSSDKRVNVLPSEQDRVPDMYVSAAVSAVPDKTSAAPLPSSKSAKAGRVGRRRNESGRNSSDQRAAASSSTNGGGHSPNGAPQSHASFAASSTVSARPSSSTNATKSDEWQQTTNARRVKAQTKPNNTDDPVFAGWSEVDSRGRHAVLSAAGGTVARIIGRQGVNVNAIREVTGAVIDVEKQNPRAAAHAPRSICVRGAADAVRSACAMINRLVETPSSHEVHITELIRSVIAAEKTERAEKAARAAAASTSSANAPPSTATSVSNTSVSSTPASTSAPTNVWAARIAARQQAELKRDDPSPAPPIEAPPPPPSLSTLAASASPSLGAASEAVPIREAAPTTSSGIPSPVVEEQMRKAPGFARPKQAAASGRAIGDGRPSGTTPVASTPLVLPPSAAGDEVDWNEERRAATARLRLSAEHEPSNDLSGVVYAPAAHLAAIWGADDTPAPCGGTPSSTVPGSASTLNGGDVWNGQLLINSTINATSIDWLRDLVPTSTDTSLQQSTSAERLPSREPWPATMPHGVWNGGIGAPGQQQQQQLHPLLNGGSSTSAFHQQQQQHLTGQYQQPQHHHQQQQAQHHHQLQQQQQSASEIYSQIAAQLLHQSASRVGNGGPDGAVANDQPAHQMPHSLVGFHAGITPANSADAVSMDLYSADYAKRMAAAIQPPPTTSSIRGGVLSAVSMQQPPPGFAPKQAQPNNLFGMPPVAGGQPTAYGLGGPSSAAALSWFKQTQPQQSPQASMINGKPLLGPTTAAAVRTVVGGSGSQPNGVRPAAANNWNNWP